MTHHPSFFARKKIKCLKKKSCQLKARKITTKAISKGISVLKQRLKGRNIVKSDKGSRKSENKKSLLPLQGNEFVSHDAETKFKGKDQTSKGVCCPPIVVLILGFHANVDIHSIHQHFVNELSNQDDSHLSMDIDHDAIKFSLQGNRLTFPLPKYAYSSDKYVKYRKITILIHERNKALSLNDEIINVLDMAKCSDVILPCFSYASIDESAFDEFGYKVLTALRYQGIPSVLGISSCLIKNEGKERKKYLDAKKFIQRYYFSEFGSDKKILNLENQESVKGILRRIVSLSKKEVNFRLDRTYLLAERYVYDYELSALKVNGYVNGCGFLVKYPVHITGLGNFRLNKIVELRDSTTLKECSVIDQLDEKLIPELETESRPLQPYNPFNSEQTWPTTEELMSQKMTNGRSCCKIVKIPKNISEYEAPWYENYADSDSEEIESHDGNFEDKNDQISDSMSIDESADVRKNSCDHTHDSSFCADEFNNYPSYTLKEKIEEKNRLKEVDMESFVDDDHTYSDYMEVPDDKLASIRFAKYRGLKSFRTSPWDVYENLPIDYSRIFEYSAFNAACSHSKSEYMKCCENLSKLQNGLLCRLYISFPKEKLPEIEKLFKNSCILVSNLFSYESNVGVLNIELSRSPSHDLPIKSKKVLLFQCGFRRFLGCPIYSESQKKYVQKKYKMERFFHKGSNIVASLYAQTIFPPCTVIAFDPTNDNDVVAWGSVINMDTNRMIIKRITLSGHPFKVHKYVAVVRFMFNNPEDVKYFKSVELTTRRGVRGHIKESLGTHGYMKCTFSDKIQQNDTVLMHLYKRVFPVWFPLSWFGDADKDSVDHP